MKKVEFIIKDTHRGLWCLMNKVLAAERMSQVQLVEARTKADVQKIE